MKNKTLTKQTQYDFMTHMPIPKLILTLPFAVVCAIVFFKKVPKDDVPE